MSEISMYVPILLVTIEPTPEVDESNFDLLIP